MFDDSHILKCIFVQTSELTVEGKHHEPNQIKCANKICCFPSYERTHANTIYTQAITRAEHIIPFMFIVTLSLTMHRSLVRKMYR